MRVRIDTAVVFRETYDEAPKKSSIRLFFSTCCSGSFGFVSPSSFSTLSTNFSPPLTFLVTPSESLIIEDECYGLIPTPRLCSGTDELHASRSLVYS